jgi:hypothetical protein
MFRMGLTVEVSLMLLYPVSAHAAHLEHSGEDNNYT